MRDCFFVVQLKDKMSYLNSFSLFSLFCKRLGRYWTDFNNPCYLKNITLQKSSGHLPAGKHRPKMPSVLFF